MNTQFPARRRFTALAGAGALVLGTLAGTAALVAGPVASANAAGLPSSAKDESKVPHYFGPWPNWANSPLTSSTAQVSFVDPAGPGAGAEATAQVDPATGGISGITVTSPGHDYSAGHLRGHHRDHVEQPERCDGHPGDQHERFGGLAVGRRRRQRLRLLQGGHHRRGR